MILHDVVWYSKTLWCIFIETNLLHTHQNKMHPIFLSVEPPPKTTPILSSQDSTNKTWWHTECSHPHSCRDSAWYHHSRGLHRGEPSREWSLHRSRYLQEGILQDIRFHRQQAPLEYFRRSERTWRDESNCFAPLYHIIQHISIFISEKKMHKINYMMHTLYVKGVDACWHTLIWHVHWENPFQEDPGRSENDRGDRQVTKSAQR